jgi:hypothetical protein
MTPQDMKRLLKIRIERENRARMALEVVLRTHRELEAKFQDAYSTFMARRQNLLDYIGNKRADLIANGASVSEFETYKQVVGRYEDEVVGHLRTARETKAEVDKHQEVVEEERAKYKKANNDKLRLENLDGILKEQAARAEDYALEQEIEEVVGDRRRPT